MGGVAQSAGVVRLPSVPHKKTRRGDLCKPPPYGHLLSKGGDKPLFDNIYSDKYRKLHSTSLLPQINIRKSPFERGCPPLGGQGFVYWRTILPPVILNLIQNLLLFRRLRVRPANCRSHLIRYIVLVFCAGVKPPMEECGLCSLYVKVTIRSDTCPKFV